MPWDAKLAFIKKPERTLELAFRQETCRIVRDKRKDETQQRKRRKLLVDLNDWTPTAEHKC